MLVSVSGSGGQRLAGASLELQLAGGTATQTGRTNLQGEYRFAALKPGSYSLRAQLAGQGSASYGPFVVQSGERKQISLTLRPQPSATLPFFDEPQFTIAGVTDPTGLGAHGSNAGAPAKDELTREVVSLGGPSPAPPVDSPAEEQALRQAAERQPADFNVNQRLGKLLLDEGRPRDALPYLQRTSRLKPADYQNSYELALAYMSVAEYDQARSTLQALLATHDRAELHHLLGDVEEKRGQPLDAAREYERAAQIDASEPNLFDWGAELLLHGATEPAIQVFSKGHRLFPGSTRMLLGLSVAWFAQGSYERAARHLCQASDLDPGNRYAYLFLGKIQEVESSPSACISPTLARFVRLRPQDAQANYYYALSLWKRPQSQGETDLEQVSSLLRRATLLEPGFAAAYLHLGILDAQQRHYSKAISWYRKAIAADPRLPDAHYRLAQAWMRTGDQLKARSEMQLYQQLAKEKAQTVEREDSHMQQFVYTLRGPDSPASAR